MYEVERNGTTSVKKNIEFANIPRTKVCVPENIRNGLFQNDCIFILHNLMENIYATHLFGVLVDGRCVDREEHYLYKEYCNDDLSYKSEVHDYDAPFPYATYFEVAYVYKFIKETQKMECIFNRNDKSWKVKEIKVPEVQPGMFVVVDYDSKDYFLHSVVIHNKNSDDLRLIYDTGAYDRWDKIRSKTEDNALDTAILYIGEDFSSFDAIDEYMEHLYRGTRDTSPYIGRTIFIHPDFKKRYEKKSKN